MFVSVGSERVKTATFSFKLNEVLSYSSSLRVQASPKRTLTKGGEYDYHTFGYNDLHSGGTVTTSLCTCICFLWRTTLFTMFIFLSIGNNVIPPQLVQMTIKAMLVPNLNLSMRLSQHADTMIPTDEIMHTPLSCYGNLLYVKERFAISYSLLKRSLRFSYGQHDIEWGPPTVLHVTMMNVKRKADIEHSLAMIEVMNRIKYVFGHGPLARITEIQDDISPITVERVMPTTDVSRQERKRRIVRMAHSVHVFNDGDVMVFGGDNECHFCREYNISLLPVIPIHGSHFADTEVTPPIGPSQPLSELEKSREELRVIRDNHSWIATHANLDECIVENYNQQQGAKATSTTKQMGLMGQVLRYEAHESSNMAVSVRLTPFTNPHAQRAALHGKTRPDHVLARAMAEERVDRESGAEEIVARGAFNEEGSVEDNISETAHRMSLLQQKMQRMKLRNH